ncbi:MAG: hypothetical protein IPM92_16510 [Saprospiraceae bacterium]|nr:hypothetical protein [Saprospiraceae bacterium]
MDKTLSTPHHKRQDECNTPLRQLQTIFKYLQEHIATASMIADATGIYQKNICRYKRDLEKAGRLWETEKKLCKKTSFKAWYLTTNPNNAPKQLLTQLSLF